MRVLGLPLGPKKLSDEQYVESVRKGLRLKRRWRYLMAALGLCLLAMVIWLSVFMIRFLGDMTSVGRLTGHVAPAQQQREIFTVYFVAVTAGFFSGLMFFNAVFHVASAFFEYRKDKLLVAIWDALSDGEKDCFGRKGGQRTS